MILAVYGTFRKGECRANVLDPLRKRGESQETEISGIKLYVPDHGSWPTAKATGNSDDKAVVELISVDLDKEETRKLLDHLDRIECVASMLYERNYIETPLGEALIYTYCRSIDGYVEITDWLEWQKSRSEGKEVVFQEAGNTTA